MRIIEHEIVVTPIGYTMEIYDSLATIKHAEFYAYHREVQIMLNL